MLLRARAALAWSEGPPLTSKCTRGATIPLPCPPLHVQRMQCIHSLKNTVQHKPNMLQGGGALWSSMHCKAVGFVWKQKWYGLYEHISSKGIQREGRTWQKPHGQMPRALRAPAAGHQGRACQTQCCSALGSMWTSQLPARHSRNLTHIHSYRRCWQMLELSGM